MNTQPNPASRPTATPAGALLTHTESNVLDANPLQLARLLCGAGVLGDLRRPGNATRAHLADAGRAMGAIDDEAHYVKPADLTAARQALRAALACAIRPDGIDFRAETILVQVALWLVDMQAQVDEVAALFATAAASAGHTPTPTQPRAQRRDH